MSTLKVATIQDLAAANSSTPEQIAQGRAKAWVTFNSITPVVSDSFNCTSITDNGTGDITANWTTALANANYSYCATSAAPSASGPVGIREIQTKTTTALRVLFQTSGGTPVDHAYVSYIVFGD